MVEKKTQPDGENQELALDKLDDIAGGVQVEIKNQVKDNKKNVKIGPTVVINM